MPTAPARHGRNAGFRVVARFRIPAFKTTRDFVTLPYNKIQAFSIETADLWFSGLGKVRLEFEADSGIRRLGQMIATYVW